LTHLKQQISLFNQVKGHEYDICSIISKVLYVLVKWWNSI